MSALDRLAIIFLFGVVGCGVLYVVGKLAHYLFFGDGWRAFCLWMASPPNTMDAVVAAVVVAVLVYARLRRR